MEYLYFPAQQSLFKAEFLNLDTVDVLGVFLCSLLWKFVLHILGCLAASLSFYLLCL